MTKDYKDFADKLNTISTTIEFYLNNKEKDYKEELELTEKWLNSLMNIFSLSKIEDLSLSEQSQTNLKTQEDGMLIINSSTEIIKKIISNDNIELFNSDNKKPKLIDFLDNSKKAQFRTTLLQSLNKNENLQIETLIKSGNIGNPTNCLLEIDISSSNILNDRIIVYFTILNKSNLKSIDFLPLVFENLPNMDVFFFDKDYRYIFCGGKEKEKFNLTNSDFIGKTLFDVYDKKSQRAYYSFYNKALNGEITEGEVRYKKEIYYIVASPIFDHKKNTIAGVVVSQNVTKDKILEEKLIKSKEQAQKADKAKSIFIANMSHEIRTPLNSIIGFNEQLKKTELTSQQEKFVDLINKSSQHLLHIVNEIVFLFKLGMDKVYIQKKEFNIYELLDNINNIYQKQAKDKELIFKTEIANNLPKILKGDSFRLRQVLTNLLTNAVKYTDNGSVTFKCKLKSETKKKANLEFQIIDTGIGIDKRDIPYIFDVFEQGNNRTQRIRGGAGLGLGICKNLVNLFKGKIFVSSELKKGSTFTVQIPFEKSSKAIVKRKEKRYHINDFLLENKKILLADDDEHNLMLAEFILKGWKSDYTLVENGQQAMKFLKSEKFDLVLLDINMNKKNGIQIVKQIRSKKDNINNATPMFAFTANVLAADISRYLKAGFDDFITKPFKEQHLYNKLCNILKVEGKEGDLINASTEPAKPSLTSIHINDNELAAIAKGDDEFYNKMIDNFINNANKLITQLKDGVENQDWNEIGERAHKAISSFKFFKLNHIADYLKKIESLSLRENSYDSLPELISTLEIEINKTIREAKKSKK